MAGLRRDGSGRDGSGCIDDMNKEEENENKSVLLRRPITKLCFILRVAPACLCGNGLWLINLNSSSVCT